MPQRGNGVEVSQQCPVVPALLRETDPRVDDHPFGRDPGGEHGIEALTQLGDDLGHDITVDRAGGHVRAHTSGVHQNVGDRPLGGHRQQVTVGGARHVVDDRGARGQRGLGDGRTGRVDAHRDTRRGQLRHHRQHPAQLLGRIDPPRARPGRLAPDVDDVGALGSHRQTGPHRVDRGRIGAPVGERVRCHIDHTHHAGTTQRLQKTTAGLHGRHAPYARPCPVDAGQRGRYPGRPAVRCKDGWLFARAGRAVVPAVPHGRWRRPLTR